MNAIATTKMTLHCEAGGPYELLLSTATGRGDHTKVNEWILPAKKIKYILGFVKMLGKSSKNILQNGGVMVICRGAKIAK